MSDLFVLVTFSMSIKKTERIYQSRIKVSQIKQLKMSKPICSGLINLTARNNRLRKVRDPVTVLSYTRMVRCV